MLSDSIPLVVLTLATRFLTGGVVDRIATGRIGGFIDKCRERDTPANLDDSDRSSTAMSDIGRQLEALQAGFGVCRYYRPDESPGTNEQYLAEFLDDWVESELLDSRDDDDGFCVAPLTVRDGGDDDGAPGAAPLLTK